MAQPETRTGIDSEHLMDMATIVFLLIITIGLYQTAVALTVAEGTNGIGDSKAESSGDSDLSDHHDFLPTSEA